MPICWVNKQKLTQTISLHFNSYSNWNHWIAMASRASETTQPFLHSRVFLDTFILLLPYLSSLFMSFFFVIFCVYTHSFLWNCYIYIHFYSFHYQIIFVLWTHLFHVFLIYILMHLAVSLRRWPLIQRAHFDNWRKNLSIYPHVGIKQNKGPHQPFCLCLPSSPLAHQPT